MSEDRDIELIEKAIQTLSEHFDTVQIFCTRHEVGADGGTVGVARGQGNWYARIGQVSEWNSRMDESARARERRDDENEQ